MNLSFDQALVQSIEASVWRRMPDLSAVSDPAHIENPCSTWRGRSANGKDSAPSALPRYSGLRVICLRNNARLPWFRVNRLDTGNEEGVMGSRQRAVGILCVLTVMIVALFAVTTLADDSAEAAVKALVERGVIMAIAEGEEAVLAAISDPEGPFIDGDLYLFAGLVSAVISTAHPYAPQMLNTDLSDYQDEYGNFFFVDFMSTASGAGAGWVEYWWPKPGETEASRKMTYIMKVAGQDLYIGCGYYPEE